jgi:hypothetical protein
VVYDAETTARNAEKDATNHPGYCLQQCRIWAGIGPMYPDATTAWRNTNKRHPRDRGAIPRGAPVYRTGGSSGYGHIAISLGGGKVRSTDAGGRGKVATRQLSWFDANWPSLNYAGRAEDINEVRIPGTGRGGRGGEDDDMPKHVAATSKPMRLNGEWQLITWESIHDHDGDVIKAGDSGFGFTGPYTATLLVKVEEGGDGVVSTRPLEGHFRQNGDWTVDETGPPGETAASGKATYHGDTRVQRVAKGRRLRWQVKGPKGSKADAVSIHILYW